MASRFGGAWVARLSPASLRSMKAAGSLSMERDGHKTDTKNPSLGTSVEQGEAQVVYSLLTSTDCIKAEGKLCITM